MSLGVIVFALFQDIGAAAGNALIATMTGPLVVGLCTVALVLAAVGWAWSERGGGAEHFFRVIFAISIALAAPGIITYLHRWLGL